jgi:hypothetical protein
VKQNVKDWLVVIFGILALTLVIVVPIAVVVARVAAPCDWIDWIPVKDLPGRCLPGGRG